MSRQLTIESAGPVGAYVSGIDLAQFDDDALAELRRAFAQFGVLFFRGQTLSPEQHIAFAQRWGTINVNRFFVHVDGYPQIAEVRKEPDHQFNIGGGWHTDHSYDREPALGSMAYARELPSQGGGTLYANTCLAYDTLSDGLKATLATLEAFHTSRNAFGSGVQRPAELDERLRNPEDATQDMVHPVVIEHPLSGRKSIYVNPGFTQHFVGWSKPESQALLDYLYAHITKPEHTIRLNWEPGTLAFWDNRATWHFAENDYQGERRLLHRITLDGVGLSA